MGNFISDQLAKFLNQRMEGVGTVDDLDLGSDSISATISLIGETESVKLDVNGIRWSTSDGKLHLHFHTARASRPWLQAILNIASEKTGKRISIPDKLSLTPVKMMFPKA
ncbi:MAG: hypothetical protein LBV12_01895 [Puniceicoccales bacterium]|jgi:hypothetical protein|nr:hypothetical protein [Puniceicoccales bacterium]